MRTLHLTNAWHPTSGGVRTFYRALLDSADRHQRHVTVVVPGTEDGMTAVGRFGRLYTIRSPRSPVLDRRYRAILPHRFLRPSGAIWRILDEERPDLVEVSDKYTLFHLAGLIKRRPGHRPTVVGLSQERFDDALRAYVGDEGVFRRFSRWYLASVYMRQFDAHIANSEYTAGELRAVVEAIGPRKPKLWRLRDRIHAEPLGVDAAAFSPDYRSTVHRADLLRRVGGADTSRLIVFAGRLSREKHAQWVVPAAEIALAHGLDVRVVIVGDGQLRGPIEQEAATALPGRVACLGHIGEQQWLATTLASADIFLHPNPREPFGIGPLEAMASGTPVVLPRAGGVLSYASDANSWLAEPSPAGLGQALIAALSSPGEARVRARAALSTAQQHDWRRATDRYFRMYDAIHAARLERAGLNADHDASESGGYSPTSAPLIAS